MKGICEFTCTHKIACLVLTCCPSSATIRMLPITNESEKETYGNGASQGTVPVYGLDTAHSETPQRHPVCVCSQESGEEDGRSLLCSLAKSGADEQRTSTRKTRLTQKIKPPERWQWKQFTAVWLLLMDWPPARSSHSYNLPAFSITKVRQQCNGYTTMWAYERRCAHE